MRQIHAMTSAVIALVMVGVGVASPVMAQERDASPTPEAVVVSSESPEPTPTPEPTPSPEPTPTPEPTESPDPTPTPEPPESSEPSGAPATASATPPPARALVAPTAPAPTPVPSTEWRITSLAGESDLGGYSVGESLLPGEPLQLKIQGTGASVRMEVFRIGHYDGAGAALVTQATAPLTAQPECSTALRTVDCSAWTVTHTFDTSGWEPGLYLTKLTDDLGRERYVPTILRSAQHRGTVAVMSATSNHAAYNYYGQYSLYKGPTGYADRSTTVSLHRPESGNGAQKIWDYELGLIQHLESLGVPLSYTSNAALHRGGPEFDGARALVTLGHDEYWTFQMKAKAQALRDAGTNLIFLGADAIYWRMRWNEDFTSVTTYREAALDPIKDSPETTTLFRAEPHPDPEADLMGSMYDCYGHNPRTDLVVVNPGFWAFKGTGATAGSRYPGLIGHEVDKAGVHSPESVHIAAHSTYDCASRTGLSDLTYYTVGSGAGVLNLGTMGFALSLTPGSSAPAASVAFVKTVVATAVREAALGPLGLRHTEAPNLKEIYTAPPPQPAPSTEPKPFDVYTTPGTHSYNGRQWRTSCSAYSTQIDRCWTDIWATQVTYQGGKFVAKNDWYFNNLTYVASPRRLWTTNALGGYGKRGPLTFTWTSGGRQWKTECDTAVSGRGGCRSYIYGSSITSRLDASGNRVYYWTKGWTFNNIVRFTD